ncbi:mismatch repair protein [Striga asiatica]|uniref:Mismatch repair protein n=1 Tax=Striga asiatica TaxID=4170 RepID=A0A5A7Q3Y3_STRAF|nr:mismatch repair protein [Striga asiatica]
MVNEEPYESLRGQLKLLYCQLAYPKFDMTINGLGYTGPPWVRTREDMKSWQNPTYLWQVVVYRRFVVSAYLRIRFKKKGKGLATAAVEEKPRFLEVDYIITEEVTGYTNTLRQLRVMLRAQGGEISGIHTLPSEAGKDKTLYNKVELVSLKHHKERAQEIHKHFASRNLRKRVEKHEIRP